MSTCYAAGGMPLAFTQEDFLVIKSLDGWIPVEGLKRIISGAFLPPSPAQRTKISLLFVGFDPALLFVIGVHVVVKRLKSSHSSSSEIIFSICQYF